jgi:polygalacturonase
MFYTIVLQSNANIYLDEKAVLIGALPSPEEGAQYLEPELNPYIGLQDYGHSFFRNSLIYGYKVHDVMIYGDGLISGCYFNPDTGYRFTTIHNTDVSLATNRGHGRLTTVYPTLLGSWVPTVTETSAISPYGVSAPRGTPEFTAFTKTANKGIAIEECQRIVLADFDMLNIGHFAFISAAVDDCLIENIVIDSNRDGFDIDTIRNFTLRNCIVNTFQDDAIVVKGSFGAKQMFKTENILVYNCIVSGFDSGTVMSGAFAKSRPSGSASNPHGRFKIGTEATTGFDRITVANFLTVNCAGLAIESVDGNSLTNFIGYNLTFDGASGGAVFITAGDRVRYPVTGKQTTDLYAGSNERLGNPIFVLPNSPEFDKYPIRRYQPNYGYDQYFVANVAQVNPNNFYVDPGTGLYYLYKWNGTGYEPDLSRAIPEEERGRYANAVGAADYATIENVYIGNVKATDMDPRLPIGIHGMVSSKIKNVTLENIDVVYRGGLTLRDAVEQKAMSSGSVPYAEYMCPPATGNYSYSAASGLPRMRQVAPGEWVEDPYNVPEVPFVYPEPANYGQLPAYGLYARHVEGLKVNNFKTSYEVSDTRPAIVLDDVQGGVFSGVSVKSSGTDVVLVTHNYKRATDFEFIPNEPFITTTTEVAGLDGLAVDEVTVEAPEPGTPADDLYDKPTNVRSDTSYSYTEQRTDFPRTVNRPWLRGEGLKNWTVKAGDVVTMKVEAVNPADFIGSGTYYVNVAATELPPGATYSDNTFTWAIDDEVTPGTYYVTFMLNDGLPSVKRVAEIVVVEETETPAPPISVDDMVEKHTEANIKASQSSGGLVTVNFPAGNLITAGEEISFWFFLVDSDTADASNPIFLETSAPADLELGEAFTITFDPNDMDGAGTKLPSGNYAIAYRGESSGLAAGFTDYAATHLAGVSSGGGGGDDDDDDAPGGGDVPGGETPPPVVAPPVTPGSDGSVSVTIPATDADGNTVAIIQIPEAGENAAALAKLEAIGLAAELVDGELLVSGTAEDIGTVTLEVVLSNGETTEVTFTVDPLPAVPGTALDTTPQNWSGTLSESAGGYSFTIYVPVSLTESETAAIDRGISSSASMTFTGPVDSHSEKLHASSSGRALRTLATNPTGAYIESNGTTPDPDAVTADKATYRIGIRQYEQPLGVKLASANLDRQGVDDTGDETPVDDDSSGCNAGFGSGALALLVIGCAVFPRKSY